MAIRIEHVAPGIYVDQMTKPRRPSASTTGRTGNRYRDVMGAEQPEGVWYDPVANAVGTAKITGELGDRQNAVQMIAERKRNERRARLGMGPIGNASQPVFHSKEEIEAERERQAKEAEWNRRIGREDDIWKRGKQDNAERAAVAQFQKDYDALFKQIDALMSEPAEAWALPERRAKLVELYNKLLTGEKNKDWNPLEKYPAAIKDMMDFLNGHDPTAHLLPKDKRPGATYADGSGVTWRNTPEGSVPMTLPDEPMMTMDDIKQGKSKNWRITPAGQLQERKIVGGQVVWADAKMPEAQKPAGEVWNDWATKWKSARDNYHVIHGTQPGNKEQEAKARAHADAMFPKPPEGGAPVGNFGDMLHGAVDGAMTGLPAIQVNPDGSKTVQQDKPVEIGPWTRGEQAPGMVVGSIPNVQQAPPERMPPTPGEFFGEQPAQAAPVGAGIDDAVPVKSREEYDALLPGMKYTLPDGRRGIK